MPRCFEGFQQACRNRQILSLPLRAWQLQDEHALHAGS